MRISDWSSDVCSSVLFAMTPGRLLIAGLFNFSLAALAVVGAAMQLFDNFLPFDFNIFNPVDWIGIAERYGLDQWLIAHPWIAGVGALTSLLFHALGTGRESCGERVCESVYMYE